MIHGRFSFENPAHVEWVQIGFQLRVAAARNKMHFETFDCVDYVSYKMTGPEWGHSIEATLEYGTDSIEIVAYGDAQETLEGVRGLIDYLKKIGLKK